MKNDRVDHIDIAKGISIILVALFHSKLAAFAPALIKPMALFRMPLFFFLSGIFLSYKTDASKFVWKKADALLKPYFVTLILLLFITTILGEGEFNRGLVGILYGNGNTIRWTPLWFLTHLFMVYCIGYVVCKYFRFDAIHANAKKVIIICAIAVGSVYIDIFWNAEIIMASEKFILPGLPFSFDLILISSTFFLLGYIFRSNVISFKPSSIIAIFCLLVFLSIAKFTDAYIDLNERVYRAPVFATVGALCGIYLILFISHLLQKVALIKSALIKFGSGSLFILIFHWLIGGKTFSILHNVLQLEIPVLLIAIFAFIMSVVVPLLIKEIVCKVDLFALFYLPMNNVKLYHRLKSQV